MSGGRTEERDLPRASAAPVHGAAQHALRAIVARMADGVVVVEESGAIVFVNPAAEALFGRGRDALLQRPFGFPLVDGETTEIDVLRPGGGMVTAELRAVPLEWEGRPAWLASLRDITDRRLAEERARELERAEAARHAAEAANRAKTEFLAMMSHELRTPLNAILGYSDLLDMGLGGSLGEHQHHQLGRIRASAQHLLGLVNEVLDLARVEEGRLTVAQDEVRLLDTVESAVALVRPQAEERELALEVECDDADAGLVVGDEDRVRQILVNLLSNAVKFTEPGGRVTVTCGGRVAPPPAAREAVGEHWLFVAVRDTGPGIEEEQREAIFAPFVQGDSGRTRRADGSGLGLAIARRLARLMRGDLTLESAVGAGSTFTLWLPPFVSAAPREADAVADERAAGAAAPAAGAPDDAVGDDGVGPASATGGDGTAPPDDGARRLRLDAIAHVGAALRAAVDEVTRRLAARLRLEAPVPGVAALTEAQLGDHVATLLADVSTVLMALEHAPGEPSLLLADGTVIQRIVAERHGLQRAPLGWTGAALATEYAILKEECERAIRAGTPQLPASARDDALRMLHRFLNQAAQVSAKAMEREQLRLGRER